MFYYGELGYEAEGVSEHQDKAELAAIELSEKDSPKAICVWDESDEVLAVAVEGILFTKEDS